MLKFFKPDDASYLFGALHGDGTIFQRKTKAFGIEFFNKDKKIMNKI